MGIQFDPINKYILITSPTTEVTSLEIYNAAMNWCDDQITMGYDVPMMTVGKFDMGGGVYSDSIFMLVNGWKIKFWSGNYQATIMGTLLPETGQSRTVPPDSGNVEVVFQVSAQGTVIEPTISEGEKLDIAEKVWTTKDRGLKIDGIKIDTAKLPSDPASESSIGGIRAKTDKLPTDPASESKLKSHITSEVNDLITRPKGLNEIYHEVDNPDGNPTKSLTAELNKLFDEIKGSGWTNETLRGIKDLIEGIEIAQRVERAKFQV